MKDGTSNKGNIGTIDIIDGILEGYPMIRRKCYLGVRFVSLASRNSGTRTILYLLLDYLQVRHRRRPPGDHEVQNATQYVLLINRAYFTDGNESLHVNESSTTQSSSILSFYDDYATERATKDGIMDSQRLQGFA